MNLTEWILASAVVLLWLYAWSLSHRIQVLREECSRWSNESEKEVRALRDSMNGAYHRYLRWSDFSEFSQRIRDRLDKLDPPRRRATDQVDDCGGPECSLCGNLTVCKKHDRLFAGISKQTLRDHIHGPACDVCTKPLRRSTDRKAAKR